MSVFENPEYVPPAEAPEPVVSLDVEYPAGVDRPIDSYREPSNEALEAADQNLVPELDHRLFDVPELLEQLTPYISEETMNELPRTKEALAKLIVSNGSIHTLSLRLDDDKISLIDLSQAEVVTAQTFTDTLTQQFAKNQEEQEAARKKQEARRGWGAIAHRMSTFFAAGSFSSLSLAAMQGSPAAYLVSLGAGVAATGAGVVGSTLKKQPDQATVQIAENAPNAVLGEDEMQALANQVTAYLEGAKQRIDNPEYQIPDGVMTVYIPTVRRKLENFADSATTDAEHDMWCALESEIKSFFGKKRREITVNPAETVLRLIDEHTENLDELYEGTFKSILDTLHDAYAAERIRIDAYSKARDKGLDESQLGNLANRWQIAADELDTRVLELEVFNQKTILKKLELETEQALRNAGA